MQRFSKFLTDFYAVFPWSVPKDCDVRLNGCNPFFLLSYGDKGFLRFAHVSDDDYPELLMQSVDGEKFFGGATSLWQLPDGWKHLDDFYADTFLPWEHRMSFFGLDPDGRIFREVYRRGHNVAVTYARVNER